MTTPIDARAAARETFRCDHWCCVLTKGACLARQNARAQGRSRGKHRFTTSRWEKSLHPYCASGTCTRGQEIAAELGGRRDVVIDPRTPPRLDIVAAVEARATQQPPTMEETSMPKTICASCKSPSKHREDCEDRSKRVPAAPAAAEPKKPAPAPARVARRTEERGAPAPAIAQLKAMRDEDLLALRAALEAEMTQREEELEARAGVLRAARLAGRARPEAA